MQDLWTQVRDWFVDMYDYVMKQVPVEVFIYIGIAVAVLILVGIVSRMLRKRRVAKRMTLLEKEVEEMLDNDLEAKYKKATQFARSNEDLAERFNSIKPKYKICEQSMQTVDDLYSNAVDLFERHKYKKAGRAMDEVETLLDDTDERIRIVSQSLDRIISKEDELRKKAALTTARVAKLKEEYQKRRQTFSTGAEYMDTLLTSIDASIEHMEEDLFNARFKEVRDDCERIETKCQEFEEIEKLYPTLYQRAKDELPKAIDEIKETVRKMESERIDASYLGIDDKLDAISNALEEAVVRLDNGNIKAAAPELDAITDQVLALSEDVVSEHVAFEEIQNSLESNFAIVDQVEEELGEITRLYASIKDRFGLEDWTSRFSQAREQMDSLKVQREQIREQLDQSETYQVEVISSFRTFCDTAGSFAKEVAEMKQLLLGASSDENRAKKQLVKLELILNEVRLTMSLKQLPAISKSFDEDLQTGEKMIGDVRTILAQPTLDVDALNTALQSAIDFIYKLYSNASNLVGVAVMVENAIVFGNRFRSSYPALDSDLTKAEMCFNNGEYTRALKIAIQAIETLHPGIYEKLVARKDPAVMNQA